MDFDARCQAIEDSAFYELAHASEGARGAISEDQVFYLGMVIDLIMLVVPAKVCGHGCRTRTAPVRNSSKPLGQ